MLRFPTEAPSPLLAKLSWTKVTPKEGVPNPGELRKLWPFLLAKGRFPEAVTLLTRIMLPKIVFSSHPDESNPNYILLKHHTVKRVATELLFLGVQATETGSFDFCVSMSSLPPTIPLTTTHAGTLELQRIFSPRGSNNGEMDEYNVLINKINKQIRKQGISLHSSVALEVWCTEHSWRFLTTAGAWRWVCWEVCPPAWLNKMGGMLWHSGRLRKIKKVFRSLEVVFIWVEAGRKKLRCNFRDLKFPSTRRNLLVKSVWSMPLPSKGQAERWTGRFFSFMDILKR